MPFSDDPESVDNLIEDATVPLEINLLREKAAKSIAKKEAAGLLSSPLFGQDKRRIKPKKK